MEVLLLSSCSRCCCCCVCSVSSDYLWPHGLSPSRLPCPWDFPGKNAGVGCHFLLQGIFPTQGSNPCFLHFGGFFTTSPPGKPVLSTSGALSTLHSQKRCSPSSSWGEYSLQMAPRSLLLLRIVHGQMGAVLPIKLSLQRRGSNQ